MSKKIKENQKASTMPIHYIKDNRQDFILHRADALLKNIHGDPQLKSEAVSYLSELISHKKTNNTRLMYIEEISGKYGVKQKSFSDELKQISAVVQVKEKEEETVIPKGADRSDWDKYKFYELNNAYYFQSREGKQKHSNFKMEPIFHIDSPNVNDSMRIYKLTNEDGYSIVIDFDMNEMTSVTAFKRKMESRGNFLFWGTESHLNQLKMKLYKETTTCVELKNLGWQREGFWAWSNGISTETGFKTIDDYGRISFSGQNYYIPAFSKIYIKDKSVYLDERKFRFIENDISLNAWGAKLVQVFGDNGKIGIAFYCATLFRDNMLHVFKNFPLLNLFGPKGTGKSQLAVSLSCLFGIQQTPYNIHNGTKAGLAEHIQQFCNSLAWIDEYKNNIDYEKVETLKSIYDAIGRNRLNFDNKKKKETTQVNSAVILSGQEMPTADVALFSRMIFCQFHQDKYSKQEQQYYDDLKEIEGKGLSHISAEIIQYRKEFVNTFYSYYTSTLKEFVSECENNNIEDRILRSMVMVVSSFRTLTEGNISLDFGFTYAELKEVALNSLRAQQTQMKSSNEISEFWQGVAALAASDEIIEGWDYSIRSKSAMNFKSGKVNFNTEKQIIQIRFNEVSSKFRKYAKSSGIKCLPTSSLEYYLKNSPYFLGYSRGTKFQTTTQKPGDGVQMIKKTTTAMCFDYELLSQGTNIDMIQETETYIYDENGKNQENEEDHQDFNPLQNPKNSDIPF